jgi:holo-[acyl-carrier protein] synthase
MNLPSIVPPKGCLVLGIGCDYIEISRIQGVLERHGDRFLRRVFTEEERAYCDGMKHPFRHYAARFAAKEAVSKAFTTGICEQFGWHSASVYHGERHQPLIRLDAKGETLLKDFGGTGVWVSLTHSDTAAMAVALLVQQAGNGAS